MLRWSTLSRALAVRDIQERDEYAFTIEKVNEHFVGIQTFR